MDIVRAFKIFIGIFNRIFYLGDTNRIGFKKASSEKAKRVIPTDGAPST